MTGFLPKAEVFDPPEISYEEIYRYAAASDPTPEIASLCRQAAEELEERLTFRVISAKHPISVRGETVDFGFDSVSSKSLAAALCGCEEVIFFAATVGVEADRLVMRYQSQSPGKALIVNAVATQRVEALCDAFWEKVKREEGGVVRPRFSPGYGDLPLSFQRKVFDLLKPERIGITLNKQCFMTPTKSVTALIGLGKKQEKK